MMRDYREIIKEEFKNRRLKNTRYSQAAFARDLELSASTLCEVLNGKHGISPGKAKRLAEKLHLKEGHRNQFIDLIQAKHARNRVERQEAELRLQQSEPNKKHNDLEDVVFKSMAIDRKRLPELKACIDDFWKAVSRDMGLEEDKTDVYCLEIQLYKLTL